MRIDTSGTTTVYAIVDEWDANASLAEISRHFERAGYNGIELIDSALAKAPPGDASTILALEKKAALYNYEGEPRRAYQVLEQLRSQVESNDAAAQSQLYTIGLLDIVTTSSEPAGPMVFYRNNGKGAFEDRTEAAGLSEQLGGLYCVQTDYDNDGYMDIFVPRGAWFPYPMRRASNAARSQAEPGNEKNVSKAIL